MHPHHEVLANGLEVCLIHTDEAPLVHLQCVVKAGSIDEEKDEEGLAHVLEHMLFKGTEKFQQTGSVAALVEQVGGDINAYTTFDHTCYYLTAPSHFCAQGIELLGQVCLESLLDSEELARESEVIIEEIRRQRDNPLATVNLNLFSHIFQGTSCGRPVIGYEQVVKNLTREKLFSFYKKWYQPSNMFVVATGDFNQDEVLKGLTKHFEKKSLAEKAILPHRFRPRLNLIETEPKTNVVYGPYQECRLQIAVQAPELESPDAATWEMVSSLLGDGDSSRLTRHIRDDLQLVTTIDSSFYALNYPGGLFSVGTYCVAENVHAVIKESLACLQKLAEEGPSELELKRVINAVKTSKIYAKESVEGMSRSVSMGLLTRYKLLFDDLFFARLNQVTPDDVKKCAAEIFRLFKDGKYAVSSVIAENKKHVADEQSLKKAIQEGTSHASKKLSKAPSSGTSAEHDRIKATFKTSEQNKNIEQMIFDLPNGKELHLNMRKSDRLPLVSCSFLARGGLLAEPIQQDGVGGLCADMLLRGNAQQTYEELTQELELKSAHLNTFSSRDTFGGKLDCVSSEFSNFFNSLIECFTTPKFLEQEWKKVLREQREVVIAQTDSPTYWLSSHFSESLYGKGHPYTHKSAGSLDSLEKLQVTDVKAFYEKLWTQDKFVLSVAGDYSSEVIVDQCISKLVPFLSETPKLPSGFWQTDNETQTHEKKSERNIRFHALNREQAHLLLGMPGYSLQNSKRTALEIASQILAGQSGRLFLDLRDKRSLAYSVHASQTPSLLGGSFSCYIASAANKCQEALVGLREHILELASTPPRPEELERAQQAVLGGQRMESQHTSYQASQLAMSDILGMPFDYFLGFEERVRNVNCKDVSNVLSELIAQHAPIVSIVGPQGTWVPEEFSWKV